MLYSLLLTLQVQGGVVVLEPDRCFGIRRRAIRCRDANRFVHRDSGNIDESILPASTLGDDRAT